MTQSTVPCPICKESQEFVCKCCDGQGFITTQKYSAIVAERVAARKKLESQGVDLASMTQDILR